MTEFHLDTAIVQPNELIFLPLGGCGEIGMNLNLYGLAGKWLMIDLGVTFGEHNAPGVDVVMPDPSFIEDQRENLLGLLLTHAHEDHVGAVAYLWRRLRCPVYGTKFTLAVLRRKLEEAGLAKEVPMHVVKPGERFTLGPFDIEYIALTHSIPEPNGIALRTPSATVFHTGDWKFDPDSLIGRVTDEPSLLKLGAEGVDILVCDSTNVFREEEAGSEGAVRASLTELVGGFKQTVAIAAFASNIARLESAYYAARANNRHLALVGRSLRRMDEAARETGYLKNIPPFIDEEDVPDLPPENVLLLCTGSQGELRAALSRIAANTHPNIVLEEGDAVIFSSRMIPGNEREILQLQERLAVNGVIVLTERDHFVHVSGHPSRQELKRMYALIKPRCLVPVHGEHRHLAEHGAFGKACGVPSAKIIENGDCLRLGPAVPMVIDKVRAGKLAVDGVRLVPLDNPAIKERIRLANNGLIDLAIVLDAASGIAAPPVLTLHGLASQGKDDPLFTKLSRVAESALQGMGRSEREDDAAIHEVIRGALRRIVNNELGRKPMVEIKIIRLGKSGR